MLNRNTRRFDAIKTHVIRGRRFKLKWRRPPSNKTEIAALNKVLDVKADEELVLLGQCDSPKDKGRTIYISPEGSTRDDLALLMTTIHEVLHGACHDLDETTVGEYDASLFELLIRMGIRVHFDGAGQRRKEK